MHRGGCGNRACMHAVPPLNHHRQRHGGSNDEDCKHTRRRGNRDRGRCAGECSHAVSDPPAGSAAPRAGAAACVSAARAFASRVAVRVTRHRTASECACSHLVEPIKLPAV